MTDHAQIFRKLCESAHQFATSAARYAPPDQREDILTYAGQLGGMLREWGDVATDGKFRRSAMQAALVVTGRAKTFFPADPSHTNLFDDLCAALCRTQTNLARRTTTTSSPA